jgi:hypothetical protein
MIVLHLRGGASDSNPLIPAKAAIQRGKNGDVN